jgi:phospholipase/lecithinase/hemolysin
VAGGDYSTIYAFGDSLSDAGNISTATMHAIPAAPYVNGEFSNGPVWVQDLAARLHMPIPTASLQGGTDFAYGGAETGQDPLHTTNPADLPAQLAQFVAADPNPQPNALYTLSIGSNDVLDAASTYSANPAAANADVAQAVANETAFVAGAAAHGAHDFVILNVPDLGRTPYATEHGAAYAQAASALSAEYDTDLNASLTKLAADDHLDLHIVDTYTLLDQGIAHPQDFGLTNVTQPVWTGTYDNPSSGTLNATGAAQAGYLFFDNLHPTATGHEILAAAAQSSLGPVA